MNGQIVVVETEPGIYRVRCPIHGFLPEQYRYKMEAKVRMMAHAVDSYHSSHHAN